MGGRAVHHFYAEDEEEPRAFMRPAWRPSRQGRTAAIALLAAGAAFVVALAIHALGGPRGAAGGQGAGGAGWAGSHSPIVVVHDTKSRARGAIPPRRPLPRRSALGGSAPHRQLLRAPAAHQEAPAVTGPSAAPAAPAPAPASPAPAPAADAAESEFGFER